jgi:hypothetical protein
MSNKPKSKHLTVRAEDELVDALAAEAARERRPLSNMVRCLLVDALAARRGERSATAEAA